MTRNSTFVFEFRKLLDDAKQLIKQIELAFEQLSEIHQSEK